MNAFSKTSILVVLLAAIALSLLYWIHAERADKAKAPRTDDSNSLHSDAVTSKDSPESQTVKAPESGKTILRLRLVDAANRPVAGAPIGQGASGDSEVQPQWRMKNIEGRLLRSDEDGRTVLALDAAAQEKIMLYARDESRKLVGTLEVSAADSDAEVTMTMYPECRVHGRLVSSELEALERKLQWTNVYLYAGQHRPLSYTSERQKVEFFVPPGRYRLDAYGTDTYHAYQEVEVRPGQEELDIGAINLPASRLAKLFGQPAPEFQKIKAWKNGGPLTLAELRGKYVLLDFWGYWCGPCVRDMPHIMAIHDAFSDRDLVVIGIHDDSVESIEQMDEKLARVREKIWMGRDLNFPVALDGGGETKINGTNLTADGATTAAYGITVFPTTLLIGPDGKVIEKFHAPSLDDKIVELEDLLGVRAKKPPWRARFDNVYKLANGQVLCYIAEPYIPERSDFFFRQFSRWGWFYQPLDAMPGTPESAVLDWDDDKKQAEGGMHGGRVTLVDLLRDFGFEEREFDGDLALLGRRVPGDWLKRKEAPREELLTALEKLLNSELNLSVRFEPRQVERDVFVASGIFAMHPLGGEYGDREIHLFVEKPDPAGNISGGGGSGNLDAFLNYVGRLGKMRMMNEARGAPAGRITWRQHRSATRRSLQEDAAVFERLLKNVSKQTSLQFKKERHEERIWLVKSME